MAVKSGLVVATFQGIKSRLPKAQALKLTGTKPCSLQESCSHSPGKICPPPVQTHILPFTPSTTWKRAPEVYLKGVTPVEILEELSVRCCHSQEFAAHA